MKNTKHYSTHNTHNIEKNNENSTNNSEDEYQHGKHPNSLKAIKKHQYPKGISGNILGKPLKFESLKNNLKKLADDEVIDRWTKESKGTRKHIVLSKIWDDAQKGDFKKIQLLAWLGCLD